MPNEQEHAENLRNVRQNLSASPSKAVKSIAGPVALAKYIDPFIDWLFGIALALALLKDILDLIGIGSFPAIGTIITFIVSTSIGFIMLVTGSFFTARRARRVAILIGGTLAESLFGINFLPMETIIVILIFKSTLEGRRLKYQEKTTKEASLQQNYATA